MLKATEHWKIKRKWNKGRNNVFHELEYSELDPHKNGPFSRKVSTQSKVKRTVTSTNGYEIINSHMLKQTNLTSNLPSHHILKIHTKGILLWS